MIDRPTIVCLCGSTRFSEAFREANLRETLAGHIVLTIGCDFKSDDALGLTIEDKARMDELHLRKIDLADEILVLNVDGYIGESTTKEILYACSQGKIINYLIPTISVDCGCGHPANAHARYYRQHHEEWTWACKRCSCKQYALFPVHPTRQRRLTTQYVNVLRRMVDDETMPYETLRASLRITLDALEDEYARSPETD